MRIKWYRVLLFLWCFFLAPGVTFGGKRLICNYNEFVLNSASLNTIKGSLGKCTDIIFDMKQTNKDLYIAFSSEKDFKKWCDDKNKTQNQTPCIDGSKLYCTVQHTADYDSQKSKCTISVKILGNPYPKEGTIKNPDYIYKEYVFFVPDEKVEGSDGILTIEKDSSLNWINEKSGNLNIKAKSYYYSPGCILTVKKDNVKINNLTISGPSNIHLCIYGVGVTVSNSNLSGAQQGVVISEKKFTMEDGEINAGMPFYGTGGINADVLGTVFTNMNFNPDQTPSTNLYAELTGREGDKFTVNLKISKDLVFDGGTAKNITVQAFIREEAKAGGYTYTPIDAAENLCDGSAKKIDNSTEAELTCKINAMAVAGKKVVFQIKDISSISNSLLLCSELDGYVHGAYNVYSCTKCPDGKAISEGKCIDCAADEVAVDWKCSKCAEGETVKDGKCAASKTCGANEKLEGDACVCADGAGRYPDDPASPCLACGTHGSVIAGYCKCENSFHNTLQGDCVSDALSCDDANAELGNGQCDCVGGYGRVVQDGVAKCIEMTVSVDCSLAENSSLPECGSGDAEMTGDCGGCSYTGGEPTAVQAILPYLTIALGGVGIRVWRRRL